MADDRPALDPVAAIAELQRQVDDLRSTMAAQMLRAPTGDVEMTWRKTAKPGTLLLQGQSVARATYPALWAWVQEQGLVGSGFGAGDGTNTFALPDMRGRVPIGAGTLGTDVYTVGQLVGAARVALVVANLPGHTHPITGVGNHIHPRNGNNRFTNSQGQHDGHNDRTGTSMAGSPPNPTVAYGIAWSEPHNHTVDPGDPSGGHDHGGATGSTGTGTPLDVRQASIGVQWLIWT